VQASDDFAACVGPVIADLRAAGMSLRQIVAELNKRGIRTMRGRASSGGAAKSPTPG